MLIDLRRTACLDVSCPLLRPTSSDASTWQYSPPCYRPYSSSESGFLHVRLGQYTRLLRFSASAQELILASARSLLRASLLWMRSDCVLESSSLWLLLLRSQGLLLGEPSPLPMGAATPGPASCQA